MAYNRAMSGPPKILAFAGPSGSGKTTAIETLIRHCLAAGRSVGAIKHTHHPINSERRGDTLRFLEAGADPVILAGDGRAAVFSSRSADVELIDFTSPDVLAARFTTDVVLVEGFKGVSSWPVIALRAGEWLMAADLVRLCNGK